MLYAASASSRDKSSSISCSLSFPHFSVGMAIPSRHHQERIRSVVYRKEFLDAQSRVDPLGADQAIDLLMVIMNDLLAVFEDHRG